jgi:hypothetical protein
MLTPKRTTFLVGLVFLLAFTISFWFMPFRRQGTEANLKQPHPGASVIAVDPGTYTPQPNIVGQITSALLASKLDHLTPHTYQDGGRQFSYNLKSVACLGTIEHGTERFVLATALFIRSSAEKSEYPPPRGHGFLLCLSTNYQLISHCPLDFPQVELIDTKLMRAKETVADFAATDKATRHRGFLIDGSDFLPYPFADQLPEEKK